MGSNGGQEPVYVERKVFRPAEHGAECHSSTLTELANGDLLAAWWGGSFEGSTDAVIYVARLDPGAGRWKPAEAVAELPDRFLGNPVLFPLPDDGVWLFFVAVDPSSPGWVQIMRRESYDFGRSWRPIETFVTQPGIRTRNHPIVLSNGEILVPLHQILGQSVFLISGDLGRSWEWSAPVVSDPGNIQPTVIARENGHLYALMRTWHEDPTKRFLWQSESLDFGRTWTTPTYSSIPTVSSAVEMIRLRNGHIVLAFNDGKDRERTPLSVALSYDGGRTWPRKRVVESGEGSFSYPSLVQTRDGHIHLTYSYNRQFIKHVEFNEAWIAGDR